MPRKSAPTKMKKNVAAGHGPDVPTSPPQTPRSSSPPPKQNGGRVRGGPGPQRHQEKRGQMPPQHRFGIHPVAGNGFNFSDYHPDSFRPDQLSPRSSASSMDEDSGDESSSSDSPPRSHSSTESIKPSARPLPRQKPPVHESIHRRRAQATAPPNTKTPLVAARIVVVETTTFTIIECDDSDDDGCSVILPDVIEYADSERSRSRSRPRPDQVDRKMASDLRNLVFSSSSEDEDEDEYMKHVERMREEKRRKRMSSGSIGKRTISERGSDSDREDLFFHGLINAAGHQESGEMRRMRRRLGNRTSLLFQDPPPPRIDELDEPDSSEEILEDSELLARELPYYNYISMEIDSS